MATWGDGEKARSAATAFLAQAEVIREAAWAALEPVRAARWDTVHSAGVEGRTFAGFDRCVVAVEELVALAAALNLHGEWLDEQWRHSQSQLDLGSPPNGGVW